MTNDEVNRTIAEWVGAEGFHRFVDDDGCVMDHIPNDYCNSLDKTVTAIASKIQWLLDVPEDGLIYVECRYADQAYSTDFNGSPSQALAHGVAAVLNRAKG
ncbi:MAG: hypothetical protein ACYCOU_00420 [Sulfobacillus sp.]